MPEDHRCRPLDRLLSWALLCQCIGSLLIAARDGEIVAVAGAVAAMIAALAAVLFMGRAAWVCAAWFALAAVIKAISGEQQFSQLAPAAQASRYALALAVAHPALAPVILRAAAALTFAAHGVEALGRHPQFVAYIEYVFGLVGYAEQADVAAGVLRCIGVIDLVVAGAILIPSSSIVAAKYMSVWGALTAVIRTVHGGFAGLPDTLVRVANAAVPLGFLRARRGDERR
ncbi:MAG TPA: hypothetical protein PKW35_13060 [Nannocystaceae bacterium]|nr:hypothetical protein [Nannocystaceae bacterium]